MAVWQGHLLQQVILLNCFFYDATLFYLPGRLISCFSGVVSVGIVYFLGSRAYNIRVGLIAAAFLSFSVLHVDYSHYVKTHVPAGMLVIFGIYLSWSIYNGRDSLRRYIISGVISAWRLLQSTMLVS